MAAILTIMGNVGRVSELRDVNGTAVIDFAVASNNKRNNTTTWVTCTAWGNLAEKVVEPWVGKGDKIFATGELLPVRAYSGNNGPGAEMKMRVTNIELMGRQDRDDGAGAGDSYGGYQQQGQRDGHQDAPERPQNRRHREQSFGRTDTPPTRPARDQQPYDRVSGDVPF